MKFEYKIKSTRNLTTEECASFFSKLFWKNRKLSPKYFVNVSHLNRPLIGVYLGDTLIACAILKEAGRALKISSIMSTLLLQSSKLTQEILSIIKSIVDDDFSVFDNCYIEIDDTAPEELVNILIKNGFQLTTIRANGVNIYTYAKSI